MSDPFPVLVRMSQLLARCFGPDPGDIDVRLGTILHGEDIDRGGLLQQLNERMHDGQSRASAADFRALRSYILRGQFALRDGTLDYDEWDPIAKPEAGSRSRFRRTLREFDESYRRAVKHSFGTRSARHVRRPPGSTILVIARYLFSKKSRERVIEPMVADMRVEYNSALQSGELWLARFIHVRWLGAITVAVLGRMPISALLRWLGIPSTPSGP